LLEQTRSALSLSKKAKKHRRGHFGALSFGISHGGGQTVLGNLKQEGLNQGGPGPRFPDRGVVGRSSHQAAKKKNWTHPKNHV